ncbi:MAG: hypothetical protein HOI01_02610 [Proteobacteria bacterium]|jgi:hypothetical protein|nr:hypothetical protein [Pseudomonadota bacterium]MBT5066553.1 hypothetical protein [Pseudomonadota bacterium]MBT6192423.1 hypothetical protein [Pseudomonadota bacterium]MBT6674404.1 hypothetical protein [Pseudomonadota bacterium]MBT7246222.1 hypothetical protein [Pseudomonadota bacterium]
MSAPLGGSQVFCVYNADSGFIGELKYFVGKLSGRADCALCDITHGPAWKGKAEWQNFLKETQISFDILHRNEQSGTLSIYTKDRLPCVVLAHGNNYEMVMNPAELESFGGDTQQFLDCLSTKLFSLEPLQ